MAWVMGITEVRHITVAAEGEQVGLRRGPVLTKVQRVITELPARSIAQVLGCRPVTILPTNTGAGPCGTHARMTWADALPTVLPLEWSIRNLIEPLRRYYATYVPPLHFGAKQGPRGRRVA